MMYLAILSSLLAVSVSRYFYHSIIPLIENSVSQANTLTIRNNQSYENLIQNHKNESELGLIKNLNANADNLYKVLEDAKMELMLSTSKKNKSIISCE